MKKLLTFVLTLSLILSMSVPAFAADTQSTDMEKALTTVKQLITIPDTLTEFTYTYSDNQGSSGSSKVWSFSWNDKGYLSSINASIDTDGNLINYNKYDSSQKQVLISSLTKEQAEKIASDFLAKAVHRQGLVYQKVEVPQDYYGIENFSFYFRPYVNGIPANLMTVNIGVNKGTSAVTSFWTEDSGGQGTTLPVPTSDKVISKDEAKKAYLEQIKLPLQYYSYYDYNKKTRKIFAAYSLSDNMFKAVDATTGKLVLLSQSYRAYDSMGSGKAESANQSGNNELSKDELDAIQAVTSLITKEKAESIIRTYVKVPMDAKVVQAYLRHEQNVNDSYIWSVNFDNGSGEVDAATGELVSFYSYPVVNDRSGDIGKDAAKSIAEAFIQSVAKSEFSQTRLDDENLSVIYYAKSSDQAIMQPDTYDFTFVRQVNGHDFDANRINISISRFNGTINSFYKAWDAKAVFPPIDQVMTAEAAFDKIDAKSHFTMNYTLSTDGNVVLVYNFIDPQSQYVDPMTGEYLDWTGNVVKEKKGTPYTDLAGHWSEKTVQTLLDNGYYLEGTLFQPNKAITQKHFLKFLYGPGAQYYLSDEDFYNFLVSIKVVKKGEIKPDAALTRQDVAKFATRYLGFDQLASKTTAFRYPFQDKVDVNYIGYASICNAMKVMIGDAKGKFNGSSLLTNAEAASVIYNILQTKE